jgi:GGDEF domain-containing protein
MGKTEATQTEEMLKLSKEREREYLLQDVGILGFLISIFLSVLAMVMAPDGRMIESCVMFAVLCLAVVLATYKFRYMAVAVAGLQVLIFTVYRVYRAAALEETIGWTSYLWIFIPLIAVGSMLLFQHLNYQIESSNDILASQMQDMVLIHALTGLYNQRALYIDLERQMAYSRRNELAITLLWVELRYAAELKTMLSRQRYYELQQKMASYLEDCIRVEDRIYAIDDDGTYAIILTCDKEGAAIVKRRIRQGVSDPELWSGIVDKSIRVELRMGLLQYDPETIENAIEFKKKTESELQYDV